MMTTLGEKPETAGSDDVSGSGGGGKGDDEASRYDWLEDISCFA